MSPLVSRLALLFLGAAVAAQDLHRPRLLQAAGKPMVLAGTWSAAPIVVDWDGDGREDLIVGDTTGGRLRFYRNIGKRTAPEYAASEWVRVGGVPLQLPTPWC